jgi:5'(3')-deoxyribonucleotidase
MNKPEVYLDMDGVIADFFTEYAKLAGVTHGNYRDIPPAKVDPTLDKMVGTDFFARLPKFPSADDLVNMIVQVYGHYHICSSPLRGDHEGSAKYKKIWIQQHLNPQPKNILITPNKAKYAKQADGTPNILIDDRGSNISSWEAAGGIGIKYQADEDSLQKIVDGFSRAKKIIQGKEKHEPQKLTSLDRGKMIAVHKSGDSDEEPSSAADLKEFATAGSTNTGSGFGGSGGSGGSVGHQMQRPAFIKRYSGSPGKSGTQSPKQPKPKMQKPTDNALDKKGTIVT